MTADSPILSVILPVYNLEEYLDFTMRNIVNDQFDTLRLNQWELIVVDDGSTDKSSEIVEKWRSRYPESIRLIRKNNGGPSTARNIGIDAATGRYIYFCDGDDIVKRNALSRIAEEVIPLGADIIKVRLEYISDNEYHELKYAVPEVALPSDYQLETVSQYLTRSNGMVAGDRNNVATVLSFYRREFIKANKIKFDTRFKTGEDELYTWKAILKADSVIDLSVPIYLYHCREASLSNPDDHKRSALFNFERIKFTAAMQPIIMELSSRSLIESALVEKIRDVYRHIYYSSLTSLIVNPRASLSTLRRAIKIYKSSGGKRFDGHIKLKPYFPHEQQSLYVKLRRVIAAYLFDR